MTTNKDAGEALQKAIYATLNGALTLSASGVVPVYDHVPEGTAKPYVEIGDIDTSEWGDKSGDGTEGDITLHIFCANRGRKDVLTIRRQIYDLLHLQSPTLDNNRIVLLQFDSADTESLGDGLTYEGRVRFRALIEYTG